MMKYRDERPGVLYTRNFLLRGICAVYLIAFTALYHQSEGLFGNNGIYPANSQFKASRPNLLLFSGWLGLDVSTMVDVLALTGILISFAGFVSRKFITFPVFAALWAIYYSLSEVMGPFENQADLLLLEAGLICIFLAPANSKQQSPSDRIGLLMIRWLLFRFVFSSGAVKLASHCPHWWRLDGLIRHMETMPLPTPLAWFSYYIPEHLLKLTMVYVYISELVVPWLFLAPQLALRKFAFYWHLFLQFHIIITGNYGYLNFLIVTLLFSLLNDSVFYSKRKPKMDKALMLVAFLAVCYIAWYLFGIGIQNQEFVFKMRFDQKEYSRALILAIKVAPAIALVCIIGTFLNEMVRHATIRNSPSATVKFWRIMKSSLFLLLALTQLGISLVPFRNIHPGTNVDNTELSELYHKVKDFKIGNEFGTHLRKMRSERLEMVIEYTDNLEGGVWTEYPFAYKPWNVNHSLPFTGPYFPRFDFKFWEAAPSNFKDHLWVSSVVLRLLQNEPAALNLLGLTQPLRKAPKYIRVMLYKFKYSPWAEQSSNYWTRSKLAEFLPPMSLQDTLLQANLKTMRIPLKSQIPKTLKNHVVKSVLDSIRKTVSLLEGSFLTFGILSTGFAIIATKKTG